MRRRNIFPDPECAGMMHPYANDGTRSDFVRNEGMMWMRATVTAVGTWQNYAQYSLNEDRVPVEGAYHVRLLAHAEGGDGMARCYVRQPNSTYLPCYAVNIPDGQTIVVERAIKVPAGCGELIVRICPAAVVGATAMMSRIGIDRLRIYFEGQNLWTVSELTKFNIDPEQPGVSNGYYPQQRIFSFGVNLAF